MDASRTGTGRRRRARFRAGLAACAVFLGLGVSAQAQFVLDDDIMPPRAVTWRLAERGFTEIGRPRFDGEDYVVEAVAPNGARVRLFVDAGDGAILGRQRLEAPSVPVARLGRPGIPGYGWTEEDAAPRGPMRLSERLVPPADIPEGRGGLRRSGLDPHPTPIRPERPATAARRDGAEPNPHGLNPDAPGRAEAPRRVARIGKPAEPRAAARATPEAPAPKLKPAEAARPDTKPDAPVAAIEPPKPAPVPTPAAVQPPTEAAAPKPDEAKPAEKAADAAPPAAKPAEPTWKDPPADAKRNVRVIGGATVVPGTVEKEGGAAQ